MITINVIGGIGNQMFQIALCQALNKKGVSAALDLGGLKEYADGHDYALAHEIFDIKVTVSNIGLLRRRLIFHFRKYYQEVEEGAFDDKVFSMKRGYLLGYWQSYKYFDFCKDSIRNLFAWPEDKLSVVTKEVAEQIREVRVSVSIHIRMGDYMEFPEIYGGICTEAYYDKAISYFQRQYPECRFFVFSNDKEYIKKYIDDSNFVIVDCNDSKAGWQDMYLMSQCNHNIIANSSFSWWGAYLNQNEGQEVIAPKKWFNTLEMKEICPAEWMRM